MLYIYLEQNRCWFLVIYVYAWSRSNQTQFFCSIDSLAHLLIQLSWDLIKYECPCVSWMSFLASSFFGHSFFWKYLLLKLVSFCWSWLSDAMHKKQFFGFCAIKSLKVCFIICLSKDVQFGSESHLLSHYKHLLKCANTAYMGMAHHNGLFLMTFAWVVFEPRVPSFKSCYKSFLSMWFALG